MKKIANPNQLNLLDFLKDLRPKNTEFSSFNIDLRFREALREAIKESPHSRVQIAMKMTELLGREITKNMIDSWTAESREGLNNIWAVDLPAFCHAVGSIEPHRVLVDPNGCFVVQGEDALQMELSKVEAEKQRLSEKGKAIKTILQGMRK